MLIENQFLTQQLKQIFALTGTRDEGVIIVVPKGILKLSGSQTLERELRLSFFFQPMKNIERFEKLLDFFIVLSLR